MAALWAVLRDVKKVEKMEIVLAASMVEKRAVQRDVEMAAKKVEKKGDA